MFERRTDRLSTSIDDPYKNWRTPNPLPDATLLKELERHFTPECRPDTLIDMGQQYRNFYSKEVEALEAMDWENGTPNDMLDFYEPNTFLSIAGYRYLIPKVFAFCMKWQEAAHKDIVDVILCKPFISDLDSFLDHFNGKERPLYWAFLERSYELTGEDIFVDEEQEAVLLKQRLV